MIYSEPLGVQISRFLDSVAMGFLLCILYIAVKSVFRVAGKGRITQMLSDGIFCVFTAFISFFYMIIENNGTVRFNLAVGQLLGGLALYLTLGRIILKLFYLIADAINFLLRAVTYPLTFLLSTVLKAPVKLFKRTKIKICKKILIKK